MPNGLAAICCFGVAMLRNSWCHVDANDGRTSRETAVSGPIFQ